MARPRKDYAPEQEAHMKALLMRGGTAESISAAMREIGVEVSPSWLLRRMQEWRGKIRGRTPKQAPPAEAGPRLRVQLDAPPPADDAPPAEAAPQASDSDPVERLIEDAMSEAESARKQGNFASFATMGRLVTTLREHQRKNKPLDVPDPNDSPDMVALGEQAEARLLKILDDWTG